MSKSSKKSDSDPPSDGSNALEILEEGIEIEHTKAYGVGIDCHSKFTKSLKKVSRSSTQKRMASVLTAIRNSFRSASLSNGICIPMSIVLRQVLICHHLQRLVTELSMSSRPNQILLSA